MTQSVQHIVIESMPLDGLNASDESRASELLSDSVSSLSANSTSTVQVLPLARFQQQNAGTQDTDTFAMNHEDQQQPLVRLAVDQDAPNVNHQAADPAVDAAVADPDLAFFLSNSAMLDEEKAAAVFVAVGTQDVSEELEIEQDLVLEGFDLDLFLRKSAMLEDFSGVNADDRVETPGVTFTEPLKWATDDAMHCGND